MAAENKIRRRGAWVEGSDLVYRYIRVSGPAAVAWCGDCGATFSLAAERLDQPCPQRPTAGCRGYLVKRVGHYCEDCGDKPFLPKGYIRPHIQAFHGQ